MKPIWGSFRQAENTNGQTNGEEEETMNHRVASVAIAAAMVVIGAGTMMSSPARAQDQVVYINSSGGVLDDINRKIHWDPFTQATGIKVVSSAPVDNAKLKAMVTSGNVEWDITEIDDGDFLRAIKGGLLAKLDVSKLPVSELPKDAVDDYGVWDGPYSAILTWNTNVFPMSGKHPTSLMDLWNL
jgi:putative spermidine/putrescine transport system substrate-binding protein